LQMHQSCSLYCKYITKEMRKNLVLGYCQLHSQRGLLLARNMAGCLL
jgi:hypothetical protein